MSDSDPAIIAIAPCGCVHGMECELGAGVATTVADWMFKGSAVVFVTVGEGRKRLVPDCPHDPKWGRL